MKKFLIILGLVVYSTVVVYMIGCGENEEDAAFVSAYPPNNSTINSYDVITVIFDNTPVMVDVEIQGRNDSTFLWELDGKTLTIRGNSKFSSGQNYVIIISWATGRKILNYAVRSSQPLPEVDVEIPDAAFESANPASGSELATNQSIKVTFDNNPGDVTVSAGTVSTTGKTRTISPPDENFTVGALSLEVTWTNGNGSQTLDYTVVATDETPPTVTDSSPENDAKNLDPATVFEDGIEITFSETVVSGDLKLMDGDNDVGWTAAYDGDMATLTGNAGQELSNETEYMVTGTVMDAAGNEAEVSITFVTK